MRIVSNTSPLISLAKIDCLSILKDIASGVLIPPMVHRELLGKIGIESERIDKALSDFIHVADLRLSDLANKEVLADLDEGQKQAIGLASICSGDVLLLLDDRAGRLVAEKYKLNLDQMFRVDVIESSIAFPANAYSGAIYRPSCDPLGKSCKMDPHPKVICGWKSRHGRSPAEGGIDRMMGGNGNVSFRSPSTKPVRRAIETTSSFNYTGPSGGQRVGGF